ncbi:fumarylacetoacetate hydrolase family protein [Pacificimonas sp. ICDLI1SI03]
MRLLSYSAGDRQSFGLVKEDGIVDLQPRLGAASLKALLEAGRLEEARQYLDADADHSLDDIIFLPVIVDPAHLWCLAINYQDHIDEIRAVGIQRDPPRKPALFARYSDTMMGHGAPILKPATSDDLDWEVELAVIIGKGGRNISEADAMDHVAGYSVFNDVSVRDYQFFTKQITAGKNFRASGALGPWMVTADEIADPHNLVVKARINGETYQDSNTSYQIHKIPAFISFVSEILDLKPGDVLATGTPSGVGFSRKPPIFMKDGDICECEVEGIGILRNPVVGE